MKEFIHNKKVMLERRKLLRNNLTDEENLLWKYLKRSFIVNAKFRRQHSVGFYILDFYCPGAKLAVELDGSQHYTDDGLEYDKNRDEYLKALNIKTLRFSNLDVKGNLNGVLEMIKSEVVERRKSTTPQPKNVAGDSTTPPPPPNLGGGEKSKSPSLAKERLCL